MTTATPAFGRGGDAAAEAAAAQSGGRFNRVGYFNLEKPGDTIVLRFLTEQSDWIYVNQHNGVPTKNPPQGWPKESSWPKVMAAVCRHDKAFAGIFNDCYVCDLPVMDTYKPGKANKAVVRVWALAVVREAVIEDGRVVGYKDQLLEFTEKDEKGAEVTVLKRNVIYVNQAMKNFYLGLNGMKNLFGTVRDRDMRVERIGTGKDTTYNIINLDKIPGHEPGTESWKKYEDMLRDDEIDLVQIVLGKADDDYFHHFFDPNHPSSWKPREGESGGNGGGQQQGGQAAQGAPVSQQAAAPQSAPDDDALKAMRDRVRGFTPGQEAAPSEQAAQAPQAPQEAAQQAPQEQTPASEPAPAAAGGMRNFD